MTIKSESWELVNALIQRSSLSDDVRAALRKSFPSAPSAMIDAATFHVGTDGVPAAIDWLADVERFLRDPSPSFGAETDHLIYHLYNWRQFQALLPDGLEGLLERLQFLKSDLADGDVEGATRILAEIEELLNGTRMPPDLE